MPAVKRLQQIFAVQEAQPGDGISAASLFTAANADFLVSNPTSTIDPQLFLRDNLNLSDLEPLQPLAGVQTGAAGFEMELTGRSGTSAPSWGILAQACGLRQVATKRLVPGTITNGPLFHGETITQATSGATATVLHDSYNGTATLLIHSDSGTFDGTNLVTGGSSGATFTPSGAAAADGFGWFPTSIPQLTFTGTPDTSPIPAGTTMVGGTSGAVCVVTTATSGTSSQTVTVRPLFGIIQASETLAGTTPAGTAVEIAVSGTPAFTQTHMGTVTLGFCEDITAKRLIGVRGSFGLNFNRGEAARMVFENLRGIPQAPIDLGAIPGVTLTQKTPAPFIGATVLVGVDATTATASEHGPAVRSFSLRHGSTTAIQEDATSATGLRGASEIVSRSATAEFEIQAGPEAQFPWLASLKAGTAFRGRIRFGPAANIFQLSYPGAVIERERGGDQDGFATRSLQLRLGSRRPNGTDAPGATYVLSYTNQ